MEFNEEKTSHFVSRGHLVNNENIVRESVVHGRLLGLILHSNTPTYIIPSDCNTLTVPKHCSNNKESFT